MKLIGFTWHNEIEIARSEDGVFRCQYMNIWLEGYQLWSDEDILIVSHFYPGKQRRMFNRGDTLHP